MQVRLGGQNLVVSSKSKDEICPQRMNEREVLLLLQLQLEKAVVSRSRRMCPLQRMPRRGQHKILVLFVMDMQKEMKARLSDPAIESMMISMFISAFTN